MPSANDTSPQIKNPIPLAFRVNEAAWRETATVEGTSKGEKTIPLRDIFRDPLERTLWLAIKSRHITNQHFNHEVRRAAESIRRRQPVDPKDLHNRIKSMTGRHWDDMRQPHGSDPFCEELFVFVIAALLGGNGMLEYTEPEDAR